MSQRCHSCNPLFYQERASVPFFYLVSFVVNSRNDSSTLKSRSFLVDSFSGGKNLIFICRKKEKCLRYEQMTSF